MLGARRKTKGRGKKGTTFTLNRKKSIKISPFTRKGKKNPTTSVDGGGKTGHRDREERYWENTSLALRSVLLE